MSEQVNLEYPIIPSEKFGIEISDEKRAERLFYEEGGLKELVDNIRSDVGNFVIQNDEDRVFIAKCVKKSATALEKYGKSVADNVKRIPKIVDGNRRFAADALDALHDAIMQPITEAKARRKRLDDLQAMPAIRTAATVGELDDDIARINAIDPQEFVELAAEFVKTRQKVVAELEAIKAARIKADNDAAELERLREAERKAQHEKALEEARLEGERRAKERMEQEAKQREQEAARRTENAAVVEATSKATAITETVAELTSEQVSINDLRAVMKSIVIGKDVPTELYNAIKQGRVRGVRSV